MDPSNKDKDNLDEVNSLEGSSTAVEGTLGTSADASTTSSTSPDVIKPQKESLAKRLLSHLNIYLLLFILVVVVALIIVFVAMQSGKKADKSNTITTTKLDSSTLKDLQGSDSKVGDAKQTLSIESNAIFAGTVLVRSNLDVAGTIKIGGPLSLPGITVAGSSSLDQVQINNLSISGNTGILGQLTVQKTITANAGASFGGPVTAPLLTVDTLLLNKDLQLTHHIDAGGGTPHVTTGGAVGGGGTVSLSGSDTAGTVTINTGSSPGTGTLASISFAVNFNATPHVVISPVGASASDIKYYLTRTSTGFTIAVTAAAPAASTFSFDYIVID